MIRCSLIAKLDANISTSDLPSNTVGILIQGATGNLVVNEVFCVRLGKQFDEQLLRLGEDIKNFTHGLKKYAESFGVQFNVLEEEGTGCGLHLTDEFLQIFAEHPAWIDITFGDT